MADLSDQVHHIRGGVQHFEQTVSVGRFPASIAIVRLDKAVDPETRRQRLTIMPFRGFDGIGPQWVEAVAFGWLARRRIEQEVGNSPSVTGARQTAVLGSLYSIIGRQ